MHKPADQYHNRMKLAMIGGFIKYKQIKRSPDYQLIYLWKQVYSSIHRDLLAMNSIVRMRRPSCDQIFSCHGNT